MYADVYLARVEIGESHVAHGSPLLLLTNALGQWHARVGDLARPTARRAALFSGGGCRRRNARLDILRRSRDGTERAILFVGLVVSST